MLLHAAVRFGSLHPYCTDLWRKWASNAEKVKTTLIGDAEEARFKPFHVDGIFYLF